MSTNRLAIDQFEDLIDGTLRERLAKEGKLFRGISTLTDGSLWTSVVIEIPAGRYIQIARYRARLSSSGVASGTSELKTLFGGTIVGGDLTQGYNFNALKPRYATSEGINVYRNSTITSPDSTLVIDVASINSTNQISVNASYEDENLLIYGDANNPFIVTLAIESTVSPAFTGIAIDFSEVDVNGNEI